LHGFTRFAAQQAGGWAGGSGGWGVTASLAELCVAGLLLAQRVSASHFLVADRLTGLTALSD